MLERNEPRAVAAVTPRKNNISLFLKQKQLANTNADVFLSTSLFKLRSENYVLTVVVAAAAAVVAAVVVVVVVVFANMRT